MKNSEYKNLKIVLSDDKVPGEFEQKIFEYIRIQCVSENYPKKETHFIITNDSDAVTYSLPLEKAYIFVSQHP